MILEEIIKLDEKEIAKELTKLTLLELRKLRDKVSDLDELIDDEHRQRMYKR